jgi:hypothetical protein
MNTKIGNLIAWAIAVGFLLGIIGWLLSIIVEAEAYQVLLSIC